MNNWESVVVHDGLYAIDTGDCLEWLKAIPDQSVDLVFCSPPYCARRSYNIGFNLRGQDWVDWAVTRFIECYRICRGLTAWVVDGPTEKFQWCATPALMMADLHRAGVKLRKPPLFCRDGISGSGGPDWLRNRYESIICASHGRLPWSDNTATGNPPKYGPGGEMSHRMPDGKRVNMPDGYKNGDVRSRGKKYKPPKKANPGNLFFCPVGGGKMGSKIAHENEAPFPEKLVEPFVRSFCPVGGIACDPFVGSGTTISVALQHGRRAIGCDIRESQVQLTAKRIKELYERS